MKNLFGTCLAYFVRTVDSLRWTLARLDLVTIDYCLASCLTEILVYPPDPARFLTVPDFFLFGRLATKLRSDNVKILERLLTHERRLESSFYRTMTKLKKLQTMRRIEYEAAQEKSAAPGLVMTMCGVVDAGEAFSMRIFVGPLRAGRYNSVCLQLDF